MLQLLSLLFFSTFPGTRTQFERQFFRLTTRDRLQMLSVRTLIKNFCNKVRIKSHALIFLQNTTTLSDALSRQGLALYSS